MRGQTNRQTAFIRCISIIVRFTAQRGTAASRFMKCIYKSCFSKIFSSANEEFNLMTAIFDFVKNIQALNITESEMAMLSALILISSGKTITSVVIMNTVMFLCQTLGLPIFKCLYFVYSVFISLLSLIIELLLKYCMCKSHFLTILLA